MFGWRKETKAPAEFKPAPRTYRLIFEPNKPIGFIFSDTAFPWSFLWESTYRAWAPDAAKNHFELQNASFPEAYRDPKRIGVLDFFHTQGMEDYCELAVRKFDCLENNTYDLWTVLFPETEIVIFSAAGEVKYEGEVGPILERLTTLEFRFCYFGLKMEKHGLFGFPRKPGEQLVSSAQEG